MLTIIVLAAIASLVGNLAVILFGKPDLAKLRAKLSVGAYLRELDLGLTESIGDRGATALKVVLVILGIVLVISNAFLLLFILVGAWAGMFGAKRLYRISAVSNVLNKFTTYINRMR